MRVSVFLLCVFIFSIQSASAQEMPHEGKESFYRAIKHSDLITILPPRNKDDSDSAFGRNFFSGGGGCPDEINIGSITEDTPIFGGVDIELFIDSDITIICN